MLRAIALLEEETRTRQRSSSCLNCFHRYGTNAFHKAYLPPLPPSSLCIHRPKRLQGLRTIVSLLKMDSVYKSVNPRSEGLKMMYTTINSCVEGLAMVHGTVDSCASLLHEYTETEDLKACKSLHNLLFQLGYGSFPEVQNHILHIYAKCGALMEARVVFEMMNNPGISAYECILVAYSHHKQGKHGITILHEMQRKGMVPSKFILVTLLSSLSIVEDDESNNHVVQYIQFIHFFVECYGYGRDVIVATAIINIYGKCGALKEARLVFDNMTDKNVISWTSLLTTYMQQNLTKDAFCLFRRMESEGVLSNHYTVSSILSSLSGKDGLNEGKRIHTRIGFQADLLLRTSILSMYSRCGSLEDARYVFDQMPEKSLITWTAMVTAYAEQRNDEEALYLYEQMHIECISPNKYTFVSVLHMCTSLGLLARGKQIHADAVYSGCERDLVVGNAILNFYGKCFSSADAEYIFNRMLHHDVVSWTSVISAFAMSGQSEEAFQLFMQMELEGVFPNEITFISLLSGCNSLAWGKVVHSRILCGQSGVNDVLGTALFSMYCLCSSPENANRVFDELPERDIVAWNIFMAQYDCLEDVQEVFAIMPDHDEVSWNTLISVYVRNGHYNFSLGLFQNMLMHCCIPTKYTLVNMLESCWNLPSLSSGKRMHVQILSNGLGGDTITGNALIHMYNRCGCIDDACHAFEEIEIQDIVSWSAMIAGQAQYGYGEKAITLFQRMQMQDKFPNEVTLINILYACSHAGLINESTFIFLSMGQRYTNADIVLVFDHCNCIVDLLGRIGRLAEGEIMIFNMPFQPTLTMWMTLLSACKMHNDTGCTHQIAKHIFELDPNNATAYIVSYNIYKSAEQFS